MKKLLFYSINALFYIIAKMLPKYDKLWIFGAWFGEKYSDNTKYLFEYINVNCPEIHPIWITKNKNLLRELNELGVYACYTYSVRGIWFLMTAKVAVVCQSIYVDLMPFVSAADRITVQLWHGTPLKKIGFSNIPKKNTWQTHIKLMFFPFLEERYTVFTLASEHEKEIFSEAFDLPKDKFYVTGYPRNDAIFASTNNEIKNKIIYMPTLRGKKGDEFTIFDQYGFDIQRIEKELRAVDAQLFIKIHPANILNNGFINSIKQSNCIWFYEGDDFYKEMPEFSLLITDYSSVYFDYLLLDRPVVFAPFDYDEYISNDRALYYNYNEVTPGPKCRNWDEVLEWIEKFKKDNKLYSEERQSIKNKFHKFQDSDSSSRIVNEIINLQKASR